MDELAELRQSVVKLSAQQNWRKRADEDIRKLSHAVEQSASSIIITDTDGNIEYVNRKFCQITGYRREEVIGRNPRILKTGRMSLQEYEELWDTITSGKEWRGEFLNERKNGEFYWESASISPIQNAEGVLINFIAVKEDITERKRAEDLERKNIRLETEILERKRAEEVLRNIASGVSAETDEVFFHSLVRYLANSLTVDYAFVGELVEGEQEMIKTIAVSAHGKRADNFVYGLADTPCETIVGHRLCTYPFGVQAQFPLDSLLADLGVESYSGVPLFDSTGQPRGLMAVLDSKPMTNTTSIEAMLKIFAVRASAELERHQAKAELKQSEARLIKAQRIAHLGNWERALTSNELSWSDEIFRIFGFEPGEFTPTTEILMNSIHPDDRQLIRKSAKEFLDEGKPYGIDYRIVLPDGSERIVHSEAEMTFNSNGEPNNIAGTIQDITARKQLERKMIEYDEMNKMKNDLLSTVSHELRTPLATIKGYSTMLIEYDRKMKRGEKIEHLESIDEATDRLTELVNHLLDMSRLEAGLLKMDKAPSDISRVAQEAVSEARLRAPKHKIILNMEKRLPKLNMDIKRIRQVLDNILDNAVKYSAENTEITVSIAHKESELKVCIADQGMGISTEDLDMVFNYMYRIKQRLTPGVSGAGLGLAISKGLIEAHGGRIWMESEEGKGTRCFFTLPL